MVMVNMMITTMVMVMMITMMMIIMMMIISIKSIQLIILFSSNIYTTNAVARARKGTSARHLTSSICGTAACAACFAYFPAYILLFHEMVAAL